MKEFKILIFLLIELTFAKGQSQCEYNKVIEETCNCINPSGYGVACQPGYICSKFYNDCKKLCAVDSKLDSSCLCTNSKMCYSEQYCTKDGNCLDECGTAGASKKCKCGSNSCEKNQYCTTNSNCVYECGIYVILPDGFVNVIIIFAQRIRCVMGLFAVM